MPIQFDLALRTKVSNTEVGTSSNIFPTNNCNEGDQRPDDLIRFQKPSDGYMDDIHDLRALSAADVAVLLHDPLFPYSDRGTAYAIYATANEAFCVVDYRFADAANSWTLAHEVGHLFGGRHEDDLPGDCPETYSHGHLVESTPTKLTMMAIRSGVDRIQYWSDPNATFQGAALGIAGESENARLLTEKTPEIANFKQEGGTVVINNDLTIGSNTILDIAASTTVKFAPNASLIINGTLNVNGTSGNPVTFTRSGSSGTWDGIRFNSGSSGTITYATIDYATKGVYVNNTNNVTIDNCTIRNFTEQGVYASNSSLTVQNSTIQNPSGASHGIYLLGGSSNPMITGNTITANLLNVMNIGIERKDSPGAATIANNTLINCDDGIKTYLSSPEIYNNYFDGIGNATHGIRVQASSSPDIHDNDFFGYTIGVWLEQSEPADLKWNNFGYSNGQMKPNEDNALRINYLTSGNTFIDNKWNNFYDEEAVDVFNSTSVTLKARGTYWFSQSIEGPVDSSNPQSNPNPDAGPGGSTGKLAARDFNEDTKTASLNPKTFALQQNFPNPFNPSTVISFKLPEESLVTLIIYDILGRRVRTLVSNASYAAGVHKLTWDGGDDSGNSLASGLYVYRIQARTNRFHKTYQESRKLVFIR